MNGRPHYRVPRQPVVRARSGWSTRYAPLYRALHAIATVVVFFGLILGLPAAIVLVYFAGDGPLPR